MRRKDREESYEFGLKVIDRCEYAVMAVATGEETPYCLPLSMVRVGETLYFHCALEGKKLDLLHQNPKVFLSFVRANEAATDQFSTYFESAMVAGTAFEIADEQEKIETLRALCEKLTPDRMAQFDRAIEKGLKVTGVWGIRMERVTAKAKKYPK